MSGVVKDGFSLFASLLVFLTPMFIATSVVYESLVILLLKLSTGVGIGLVRRDIAHAI